MARIEKQFIHKNTCGICDGSDLVLILDLGEMPLANAFLKKDDLGGPEGKFPLRVYFCRACSSLQLLDIVDPDLLFKHYDYLTSASGPLADHFIDMGKELAGEFVKSPKDLFLEIGGNDGVLLEAVKDKCQVINVEPAKNIAKISQKKGIETIIKFFNEGLARNIIARYGSAKVVVANNVMAHMRNIREMFKGVKELIGDLENDYPRAIELFKTAIHLAHGEHQATFERSGRLKLALAYYFNGQKDLARETFSELGQEIDFSQLTIYPDLKPVLDELGIK